MENINKYIGRPFGDDEIMYSIYSDVTAKKDRRDEVSAINMKTGKTEEVQFEIAFPMIFNKDNVFENYRKMSNSELECMKHKANQKRKKMKNEIRRVPDLSLR
eukprot:TRINITY_DN4542_c0_g1_i1.p1 TRINITY_DN4542_c0_g1~~TRINITY_DN4542_c0_g1_i1.p1  ORF type:complete len:103 (+),score=16.01 TRINITY_DN4542_c0_g1_i1:1-309(+)